MTERIIYHEICDECGATSNSERSEWPEIEGLWDGANWHRDKSFCSLEHMANWIMQLGDGHAHD